MGKAPKSDLQKIDPQTQARILSEALPHMQRYDEEIVVVKYGGHAMGQEQTARDFASDIVLLEQTAINPVVVHGGGPQIEAMLKKLGIKSEFAAGLRITDAATVEIVEMVLAGSINKQIVSYINAAGGKAIGLCGKDGNMVQARKVTRTVVDPDSNIEKVVDLGFVGEPEKVDLTVLNHVLGKEMIPVLAPVATSASGGTFNVNADTFAGAIAGALKAKRLLLLTDVPGVLDKDKNLITDLSVADARRLIADGTISGGMIPKVETCIYALDQGVEGVVIMDGKIPHAVLLELLTDHGVGTRCIGKWRWHHRHSSPPHGSKIIWRIKICASSRSARATTTRPTARAISPAPPGSTGNRRAGTRPTASSFRRKPWHACSAAWASGRIPPSCSPAIRFNSAPMPSGLSPWPGIATFACSTARAANGWRKAGSSRVRLRAFLRLPIPRRPETRRRASAATMCSIILRSPDGCCSMHARRKNTRASASPTIPSPSTMAPSARGAFLARCIFISSGFSTRTIHSSRPTRSGPCWSRPESRLPSSKRWSAIAG